MRAAWRRSATATAARRRVQPSPLPLARTAAMSAAVPRRAAAARGGCSSMVPARTISSSPAPAPAPSASSSSSSSRLRLVLSVAAAASAMLLSFQTTMASSSSTTSEEPSSSASPSSSPPATSGASHAEAAVAAAASHDEWQGLASPSNVTSITLTDESRPKFGPRMTVFSGGTGFNATSQLLRAHTNQVTYLMPVSDNGGSTAEISRVLGGPAMGDIRSRLMALASSATPQERAVANLLRYRLPTNAGGPTDDDSEARLEWNRIVEGTHPLWNEMAPACKSTIRAFLVHFQHAVLSNTETRFDFRNGSIGNFFFTGTRLFFRSMEAAIWWFSGVTSIPRSSLVVPIIHTNSRVTIGAELRDGRVMIGQSEISHPPPVDPHQPSNGLAATLIPPHPVSLVASTVDKGGIQEPLPAPIKRVLYMNKDAQPTHPTANPYALYRLRKTAHVVYGQGSLYTSIMPSLILPGVGEAVASLRGAKILVLNGSEDRETFGMTAVDFVCAVRDGLSRYGQLPLAARDCIDTLVVPEGGPIICDVAQLRRMGVRVVSVASLPSPASSAAGVVYDEAALVRTILAVTASTQS